MLISTRQFFLDRNTAEDPGRGTFADVTARLLEAAFGKLPYVKEVLKKYPPKAPRLSRPCTRTRRATVRSRLFAPPCTLFECQGGNRNGEGTAIFGQHSAGKGYNWLTLPVARLNPTVQFTTMIPVSTHENEENGSDVKNFQMEIGAFPYELQASPPSPTNAATAYVRRCDANACFRIDFRIFNLN